jgi:SAM-dependent methyltransferase
MNIDLGCGRNKIDGCIGFDIQSLPGVDIVGDANFTLPFADNCADIIYAYDFLEHINNDKRIHIMSEIWRILKPGGLLDSKTPSTDGRGAFQDPTHYSFWNENSFWYYLDGLLRNLYNIVPKFKIEELYTTEKDEWQICHVIAKLIAIK